MTTEQAMTAMELVAMTPAPGETRARAMTSAQWLTFFMEMDHEDDKDVPGPYEQGANQVRQAQFEEYWD